MHQTTVIWFDNCTVSWLSCTNTCLGTLFKLKKVDDLLLENIKGELAVKKKKKKHFRRGPCVFLDIFWSQVFKCGINSLKCKSLFSKNLHCSSRLKSDAKSLMVDLWNGSKCCMDSCYDTFVVLSYNFSVWQPYCTQYILQKLTFGYPCTDFKAIPLEFSGKERRFKSSFKKVQTEIGLLCCCVTHYKAFHMWNSPEVV